MLGYLFGYMLGINSYISLGSTIVYLIESIWNTNWVVLGFVIGNYFGTSFAYLLCYSLDF